MRALVLVPLIFCAQEPISTGRPGVENLLDQLTRDLRFPDRVRIDAVSEYTHRVVRDEDKAKALAYLRTLLTSWAPRDASERKWLDERRYTSTPEWRPAIIASWHRGGTEIKRVETLELGLPRSVLTSRETARMPDGDEWTVVQVRVADGAEVVSWQGDDGGERRVVRETQTSDRAAFLGAFYAFAGLGDLVSASIAGAEEDGAIVQNPLDDRVTWWLDLCRPSHLVRLPQADIPAGFGEFPGHLSGEYNVGLERATLTFDWRDAKMGLLARHQVVWDPGAQMPTCVEYTEFVPGTDRSSLEFRIRFHCSSLSKSVDDLHWPQRPGDYIVDRRFNPPLSYRVDENGDCPSRDALMARAAKAGASMIATTPVRNASVECASGEVHGPDSRSRLGTTRVELGTHPPSAVVPVEIEIQNRGGQPIELGDVRADCGCIAPVLTSRTIPSRASVVLTVRQQMRAPGRQITHVSIPIRSGGSGSIEIELQAMVEQGTPTGVTNR